MAQAEEIKLQVRKGFWLAGKAWGPLDGEPWLVLHGYLDNASAFDFLCPQLPSSWRLVCLDFAGHGHSDHRANSSYVTADYVADVWLAAVALGWQRGFSLLGHSMGGNVGVVVAGMLPEKVHRLVLLDILGPGETVHEQVEKLKGDLPKMARQVPSAVGDSPDTLELRFEAASKISKALRPTEAQQLELYGLFKQATMGRCGDAEPSDVAKRKRWAAWHHYGYLPSSAAKAKYVELVESCGGSIESATQRLLDGSDFASLEEAAEKRAAKNIVGTMPLDPARVLVTRSLEAAPGGGVRWRSDRNLTKPMPGTNFTVDAVRTICAAIQCPTLAITIVDGVYNMRHFGRPYVGDLLSVPTRLWLHACLCVFRVSGWLLPHSTLQKLVRDAQRGLRPSVKMGFFRHLSHVHLPPGGGHHFHMTEPGLTASTIRAWVARTDPTKSRRSHLRRIRLALRMSVRWSILLLAIALLRFRIRGKLRN